MRTIRPIAVTNADVVRLIHYNPRTGVVTNRVDRGPARAGEVAGTPYPDGRTMLCLCGFRAYLHRFIWLYCYGYLPLVEIDHWDGNPANNRLWNLRLCVDGVVGAASNVHNQRRAHGRSQTGLLGAYPNKRGTGFRSSIMVGGEVHYLGHFKTAKAANEAYVQAKRKLHQFCTI